VHRPTGHFTQEDPIGLAGGMNLYGFAGGDRVNYADPLGLCPEFFDGSPCKVSFGGLTVGASLAGMNVSASFGFYAGDGYSGLYGNISGGVEKGPSPKKMSFSSILPSVSVSAETGGSDNITAFDGHSDQVFAAGGAGTVSGSVARSWNGNGYTVTAGRSIRPGLAVGMQGSNTKLLTKTSTKQRPVDIRVQADATSVAP
jgi:hypothetical protein